MGSEGGVLLDGGWEFTPVATDEDLAPITDAALNDQALRAKALELAITRLGQDSVGFKDSVQQAARYYKWLRGGPDP